MKRVRKEKGIKERKRKAGGGEETRKEKRERERKELKGYIRNRER